jgi:LytS/YehU family sensor histidine kinase
LFLQPLVENAVTHGIAEVLDGGTITVNVDRSGDRLAIAIENPCDPDALTPMRHGTGMTNVRQRLNAMFGPAATLSAHAASGRFRVDINLPFSSDD